MNKTIFILPIALLLSSGSALSQKSYTLKDVVQLARTKSTAWLSAETRKENSYWIYRTYRSDYNPQLLFSGTVPAYNQRVTPVTQPDGSLLYRSVKNNTVNMQLGLQQVIAPTGGNITVYTNANRFDDFQTDFTQYSGEPISVGLSQPIFQYNAFKWNRLIKPLVYQESQKRYFEELEQISIGATRRFFDLLLAQINLDIARKNVQSNDTIYQIAQGRYNLGKITENDLLQLELNLVNSRLAVSQALVDQQQADLNLKSFIGLSENNTIDLTLPENIPEFLVDENVALAEAHKNKPDFVSYDRRLLEAKQEVARAQRSSGVNMNLDAVYGLNNQGLSFSDVYNNTLSNVAVALRMTVPVLDWGRQKARRKTAEANQKLVEYQLKQDKETFDQDILTEVRNFNMLRKQLESRIKSDQIANRAYGISKQLFLIGKISITDLNQSLASKDLAKQNYISTLVIFGSPIFSFARKLCTTLRPTPYWYGIFS